MNPLRQYLTTPLRQWLSDRGDVYRGQRELSAYGQAYYGFWDLGPMEQRWFFRFLQRPAFAHLPNERRLNFFSVFCRRRLLGMVDQTTPKVFFTGENLSNYPAWQDHALREVDLALGFAQLEADNYLRFPLWVLDIFDPMADLSSIQARLTALDAASKNASQRQGFAALIARHDNNGIRGQIADLLAGLGQVDYPGAFRNNVATPLGPGYPCKLAVLKQYRFNICPENANAPSYVTEKVWHAIEAGCIPVYWGADYQPEHRILNPEAILFFQPDQPRLLQVQMEQLLHSPEELRRFTQQTRFQPEAVKDILGYYLRLEAALLRLLA